MARVIFKEKCSESINYKRRYLEKDKQNTISLKQNSKGRMRYRDYQIYQLKYLYVFIRNCVKEQFALFFLSTYVEDMNIQRNISLCFPSTLLSGFHVGDQAHVV